MKKYNEIQLTKNKMNFNNGKMKNHPLSPVQLNYKGLHTHMGIYNYWIYFQIYICTTYIDTTRHTHSYPRQ